MGETLDEINAFVKMETGDKVKDALRYIINYVGMNVKIGNNKNPLKNLCLAKLDSDIDIYSGYNKLIFHGEDMLDNKVYPKQVFFLEGGSRHDKIKLLNSKELYDCIKIVWDYVIVNEKIKVDYHRHEEKYYLPLYCLEIFDKCNYRTIMNNYTKKYTFNNWDYIDFKKFINYENLTRGHLLSSEKISDSVENWGLCRWDRRGFTYEQEWGCKKVKELFKNVLLNMSMSEYGDFLDRIFLTENDLKDFKIWRQTNSDYERYLFRFMYLNEYEIANRIFY